MAAAARRRFGVDLPYDEQVASAARVLTDEELQLCVDDTHADAAIAGAQPYPHAVATVNAWYDAGHEIHVTSHRPSRALPATRRWLDAIGLRRHALWVGDDKIAYCVRAGVALLVDDSPGTLVRALGAGMRAAALRHPWNEDVCAASGVLCAADWQGLAVLLAPVLAS